MRAVRLQMLLPLAFLGCQLPGDTSATAALETKLDQTDARLAAIETKLDGVAAKLDTMVASAQKVPQIAVDAQASKDASAAKREAREAKREERRTERETTRDLADPLGGVVGSKAQRPGIPGAAEGIQCEDTPRGHKCTMDRALVDSLLANPAALAKQARVVPAVRDGRTRGYKLYGIRPGSLLKLLSFKNGDMLSTFNGRALGSIDEAMGMYTDMRDASEWNFELERKGKVVELQISIIE